MNRVRRVASTVASWVKSPFVVLATLAISLTSFTIALQANARSVEANMRSTQEASARASQAEWQGDNLRNLFCGLVEPLAFSGRQGGPSPASTSFGQTFVTEAGETAKALGCSPDPTDGR